ncbi:MAG: type II/IV secretion system protein [Phycisphaerae bacterium]|nr:type II/IV secretion system protein [Phycisphaerae bacterium]
MKFSHSVSTQLVALLRDCGVVSPVLQQQLQHAAQESGRSPLDILLASGQVREEQIAQALSQHLAIPRMSAPQNLPAVALDGPLPASFAYHNRIVPLQQDGSSLQVAVADPAALSQMSNIRVATGLTAKPVLVTIADMERLLGELEEKMPGGIDPAPASPGGRSAGGPQAAKVPARRTRTPEAVPPATTDEGQPEVIRLVNRIIFDAIERKVSDIHLEPYKDGARLRYRLDGVLAPQDAMAAPLFKNYAAVTTRIKIMAALDIAERRLPQDGAIAMQTPDGREVDLRVSILPTSMGERVVMRILDRGSMSMDLKDLGFEADDLERFMQGINASQGMVLVTGPTGSGKTTTLYGALRLLNEPGINILTAEDPVEFGVNGLGQVQINDAIELTFAKALRSFLRQDPEVILVGEIRDKETSDIAIKAALTGHLVLSTLHTNDAIGTITRLINMGTPGYLIGAALSTVVGQRLARRNCTRCQDLDLNVNDKILLGIGFSAAEASRLRPSRGKGCEHCGHTGYKGRVGIYEVLRIGDKLRAAIIAQAPEPTLMEIALQEGFHTMQHNGRALIMRGQLSVEEYQRNLVFN